MYLTNDYHMPSLEEIEKSWSQDLLIEETKLGEAQVNTPRLHQKYYTILIRELYALEQYDGKVKEMEHWLDLLYQPNRLTDDDYDRLGWEPLKRIPPTAQERARSISLDQRMIEAKLQYSRQKLKTDYLKEIVARINQRGWDIRNLIEVKKFESGI